MQFDPNDRVSRRSVRVAVRRNPDDIVLLAIGAGLAFLVLLAIQGPQPPGIGRNPVLA